MFKDTGHYRPENMDAPNDSCKIKISPINLNIQSIKKEFGDNFHSLIQTRNLFQKEGVNFKETDKAFL